MSMGRTCLYCGHEFVESDDPAVCPVCDSIAPVEDDRDNQGDEEDIEGIDDGVWQ